MRVHERGVGETRSCGTGTVAAAVAALAYHRGGLDGHAEGCASRAARSTSPSPMPPVTCADPRHSWPEGDISDSWWRAPRVTLFQMHSWRGTPDTIGKLLMTDYDDRNAARPSLGELALEDRTALRRVAGLRPNSPTSPRSNTASCGWNALCWSVFGPRAVPRTSRRAWPNWPRWPRPPAPRCSKADPAARPARRVHLHRLRQSPGDARHGAPPPGPTP